MRKRGFTLIELLIVIAIIGILAVALVPTGMNAIKKARDGTRISHLNAIATAMQQYVLDDGNCPEVKAADDDTFKTEANITDYLQGGIMPSPPNDTDTYHYMISNGFCIVYTEMEFGNGNYAATAPATGCTGVASGKIAGLALDSGNMCFVAFAEE